jgi:acylphosphatase
MEEVKAHCLISGRVQGVFFRASTRQMAEPLGLSGYVRNLPSGQVEAVFEGPKGTVEKAVEWCRQGPPTARVSGVDVNWSAADGQFQGFGVRY